MTIATESNAGEPARTRVGIDMADKTGGPWIGVPLALVGEHEPALMGLGVRSPHTVGVDMTRHARGIGALRIMARCAALDVPLGKRRVQPASRTDTDDRETCLPMARRTEGLLIHVSAGSMTFGTEFLGGVTAGAFLGL